MLKKFIEVVYTSFVQVTLIRKNIHVNVLVDWYKTNKENMGGEGEKTFYYNKTKNEKWKRWQKIVNVLLTEFRE